MITAAQTKIRCRYCGGHRPTSQSRCLGCGMPVENARAEVKPSNTDRPKCPGCGTRKAQALDNHRYLCIRCGTEFEQPDSYCLDTRPDRNAEKMEALTRLVQEA